MKELDLIEKIDENFNLHARTIPGQIDAMEVHLSDHLCYVDSGLACDTFNIIHILNGEYLSHRELKAAIAHFDAQKFPYCIWINRENLLPAVKEIFINNKLTEQNEEVGMALDLEQYSPIIKASHDNVTVVTNRGLIDDYAKVIAENWTPADVNVLRYYELTADKYLEANNISLLTYYLNQMPVSTVELIRF
jgi:hypothetical protein